MTITEFLEARIAEDEVAARKCLEPKNLVPYGDERIPAIKPEEWGDLVENYLGGPMGTHCARHDPSRVLAECAAKRAIIANRERSDRSAGMDDWYAGYSDANYDALHALAAVYASHPDYRQEWAL